MMTLYDMSLSGNCHKVRLLLSFLALPYRTQPVDLCGGEQRTPFGQVPVLDDDGLIVRDSHAILVYLAKALRRRTDAYPLAQIVAWLSTAANEIFHGPAKLRVHHKFGSPIDTATARQTAEKVLGIIDRHLQSRDWLVGDHVAVYHYLAPEGDLDIGEYANIIAWFQRIRALPGYVASVNQSSFIRPIPIYSLSTAVYRLPAIPNRRQKKFKLAPTDGAGRHCCLLQR